MFPQSPRQNPVPVPDVPVGPQMFGPENKPADQPKTDSKAMAKSRVESLLGFSRKLLRDKIFNCIRCDQLLNIPIHNVEKTGDVCSSCFASKNPQLRSKRNIKLEKILEELIVPCRYQGEGCKAEQKFQFLDVHQSICRFRTIHCWLKGKGCEWNGFPKDLGTHYLSDHKDDVIKGDNNFFHLNVPLGEEREIMKLMHSALPMNRFINIKIDKENLYYRLFDDKNSMDYHNSSNHLIKHIGKNNNFFDVSIKPIPLGKVTEIFNESNATKVNIKALKECAGATDTILLAIKPVLPLIADCFLENFECQVCNNFMRPPIYLCRTGHGLCNACKPKLVKCPTCKADLTYTRNYSLEHLTKGVFFNCVNKDLGCEEILAGGEIESHEVFCGFKCSKPSKPILFGSPLGPGASASLFNIQ